MALQATFRAAVLICSVICILAKVGFVKDQSEDAEFPPFSQQPSEGGIPQGHLRPLGWQRRPNKRVRELKNDVSALEMFQRLDKTPFVFRNITRKSDILKQWANDDYLRKSYGNLSVSVTVKKEVLKKSFIKSMSFKKFLLDYMYEDWLLTNTLPAEMEAEVPLPPIICGSFAKHIQEAELWMSGGGTSSLLHSHDDSNFHCVLFGRKDFIVIKPEFKDIFDYRLKYKDSLAGSSPLDMDMINMYKFKRISQVPWMWTTLKQGDCILIPAGYLHQVRSYGRSISFAVLIGGFSQFDSKGCPGKENVKLDDVHKTWTYLNGSRQLSHVRLRPIDVKYHLLKLMRTQKTLTFEVFEDFYYDVMQYYPARLTAKAIFQYIDPRLNGFVTKKDLLATSHKTYSKIARVLNAPNEKGRPVILHDEF